MKHEHKIVISDRRAGKAAVQNDPLRPAGVGAQEWLAMPEADRLAAMNAAATPPAICGPEIPVAPARRGFRLVQTFGVVPGSIEPEVRGTGEVMDLGYQGSTDEAPRRAIMVADAFDRMEAAARRVAARSGEDFVAPFTAAQVEVGRLYRSLVELREAGMIKLTSIEGRVGGSGSGAGGWMDAYLANGRRLEMMHERIGAGVAMQVRRVRPSARGGAGARNISDRVLVDCVCLREMALSEVLANFGWSIDGKNRRALTGALSAALGRMAEGGAKVD